MDLEKVREYIFLYGTLLPSQSPLEIEEAVQQLRPIGLGWVRGHLYDLGDYPGAVINEASSTMISGEVFELPDNKSVLASLDEYEGFYPANPEDSLFLRKGVTVTLSTGGTLDCWIYVYNRKPLAQPLESGDGYVKWEAAKEA